MKLLVILFLLRLYARINIFRYSDKKTESDKITSAFIWCCDLVTLSTFLAWSNLYI